MSFVVGLDLSLTSSGVAALSLDDGDLFTTAVLSKGKKADSLSTKAQRISSISQRVIELTRRCSPQLIIVESALFSTTHDTSAHRRGGLWWMTICELLHDFPVIEVAPTVVKKFATGRGNSDKLAVALAVSDRWGSKELISSGFDRADAAILAAIGSHILEAPVLDETKYRTHIINTLKESNEDTLSGT